MFFNANSSGVPRASSPGMNPQYRNEGSWGNTQRTDAAVLGRARVHAPGPVYAFVPAHGDSRAGTVQEHLGRTWSEGFGLAVLLVDFAPGCADDPDLWEEPEIRH